MTDAAARPPRWKRLLRWGAALLGVLTLVLLVRGVVRGTRVDPERTTPEGLVPDDVESRLIERDGRLWIQLSAVIEAPIAPVWKIVHDHERMTEFMPRMARLQVLEERGDRKKVRIDFNFGMMSRFTEIDVEREVTAQARVERWSRTGGTIPVNRGRWVLVPIDARRTFARYEVDVDSGLPVPDWFERAAVRDALRIVLYRVRDRYRELRASDPAYVDSAE